jgi:hypothetical protein
MMSTVFFSKVCFDIFLEVECGNNEIKDTKFLVGAKHDSEVKYYKVY